MNVKYFRLSFFLITAFFFFNSCTFFLASGNIHFERVTTKSGFEFLIATPKNSNGQAVIFLTGAALETFSDYGFSHTCRELLKEGFTCVSLDLPCHGKDIRRNEVITELMCWRKRTENGEDIFSEYIHKFKEIIEELDKYRFETLSIQAISRGAYFAMLVSPEIPKLKHISLIAPVLNLDSLLEFKGSNLKLFDPKDVLVKLLNVSFYLKIGNKDERVNTYDSLEFVNFYAKLNRKNKLSRFEFYMRNEFGHDSAVVDFNRSIELIKLNAYLDK
jgi:alpha-beta hydrolase superfamily lysophospholipase